MRSCCYCAEVAGEEWRAWRPGDRNGPSKLSWKTCANNSTRICWTAIKANAVIRVFLFLWVFSSRLAL